MVLIIILGNVILFLVLYGSYTILKAQIKKRILFDISYLYRFKYTITPIVIGFFNVILFSFLSTEWLPIAFLILLIPVLTNIINAYRQRMGNREYLEVKEVIEKVIWSEINKQKISVVPESVHIRILDQKENGKKKIEIIMDVPSKSPKYFSIKRSVLNELKNKFQSAYVFDLLLNEAFKKKTKLILGI